MELTQILLILHFLGLAMGLSGGLSGLVVAGIMAAAAPQESPILARFPAKMMRVGDIGLVLLWVTGLTMLFTKWNGFSGLPWQFHAKLTAVVLLTLTVGFIHSRAKKAFSGDAAAAAQLAVAGKFALLMALTAVVFAVMTFN